MAQSLRNRLKIKNEGSSTDLTSTPMKPNLSIDKDYSPVYLTCTQESLDKVDVLWDWNSPQSKPRTNRRPKRIINHQKSSPLPLKKHAPTTNSHRTFDEIRDELMAFREDIVELDDAELDFNCSINNNHVPQPTDDLFDDSLEQELLMVSQQVEEKLKHNELSDICKPLAVTVLQTPVKTETTKTESPRTLTKSYSSNTLLDSPNRTPNRSNFSFKGKFQQQKNHNSFNLALEEFDDTLDMFPELPTSPLKTSAAGSASASTSTSNVKKESPLKFKTKSLSFGHTYVKKSNEEILREEIEKKRLAALAKLRAKHAPRATVLSDSDTSPIKCSPEEIEYKRKQALARLEQKKQQELIERNRLEALKKLELRRKNRRP